MLIENTSVPGGMGGLLTGRFSIRKPLFGRRPVTSACFFPQDGEGDGLAGFCDSRSCGEGKFRWFFEKTAWQIEKAFVLALPTLRQRRHSLVAQR